MEIRLERIRNRTIIVITGPQACGKTRKAREVQDDYKSRGVSASIHDLEEPWDDKTVNQILRQDSSAVIIFTAINNNWRRYV